MSFALVAIIGILGGLLGSMVGLGGGVLIVPLLTLSLNVPIHQAIAASLVAVVATSTSAAIGYVRDEFSNMRLGMTLETTTTLGAVTGGLAAASFNREMLMGIFGAALILAAAYLFYGRGRLEEHPLQDAPPGPFDGRYMDPYLKREVRYQVRRLPLGLAASLAAGSLSGLLGIGGGPIKVPVMVVAMGIPMKAAAATSNFMIGVTACASAYIYYARGMVNPMVAIPVALGATAGALAGSRLAPKVRGTYLTAALAAVLLMLSIQMLLAAFGLRLY
ncbi:MAG: hypothetical protein A3G41_06230 [Elusimicrobia bacterium RIFCSPLOWO2_12_FULL_59_9]|nr:MAG: hypothetical protein A3G41_06230 [Elusimicrobia bacterium RIFCSPLOWO2_12_FULL_59_9]